MSNQNENVELETTEIEHYVDMGQALNRLRDNPDFKKVIIEGYFRDKAADSVSLLSMPAIKKRGERGDIMEDLVAISNLQFFFSSKFSFFVVAENWFCCSLVHLINGHKEELKITNSNQIFHDVTTITTLFNCRHR